MLDYVYGQDQLVAQAVAQLIPHCRDRGFGKCKAIGVLEDGKLVAGVVYHNWQPEAGVIEISGASISPRWLTRETLRHMYQFPFLQVGVQMIVQWTPAENERLLRQLAAFGYTFIRVPRALGRNKDAVLCQLTIEDWQSNKFNKRWKHHVVDAPEWLSSPAIEEAA